MSRRLLFLRVLTVLCAAPPLLAAQRPRFGIAAGKSFVGGGDSRTLVDAGGFNVTGADQAGFHIRGVVEVPQFGRFRVSGGGVLQHPAFPP